MHRLWSIATFLAAVLAAVPCAPAAELPIAPKPIKRTLPDYPAEAWKQGISGEVRAVLAIDDDGDVDAVTLVSEIPVDMGFGAAAAEALKAWEFPPGKSGRYRVALQFKYEPDSLEPDEAALPKAPQPVKRVAPKYPRAAIEAEIGGAVALVAQIDAEGRVGTLRVSSEQPPGYDFGAAAITAVSQWRFPPGTPGYYQVEIRFSIEGQDDGPPVAFVPAQLKPAPEPSWREDPGYPPGALERRVEGFAEIAVQIDDDGDVTHALALSESPAGEQFAEYAFKAVIKWRFKGTPEGAYRVRVDFKPGSP